MRRAELYGVPRVRPWSWQAFLLGFVVVAASAALEGVCIALGVKFYFAAFLPSLFVLGIVAGAPAAVFAALLTVPTSLYIGLGGELRGGFLVALLPLFPAMGALAVRSGRRALAVLLLLVPLGYFSWFGWNVAHQAPPRPSSQMRYPP